MNAEADFNEATIRTAGGDIRILLTDVIVIRQESDAGSVQWRLELGISRADPEQMEWSELDDLVQGCPDLQFRINDKTAVPVDEWFGETGSRIGDRLPDISLAIDLTWHDIEGPVDSVEALWVDDAGTQSLGHLLVRPLGYVPVQPRPDPAAASQTGGTGCGASVLLIILVLVSSLWIADGVLASLR